MRYEARAQMLEHLLRDARARGEGGQRGSVRPLRIGGTPGALVSLLPLAMARIEERLPHYAERSGTRRP